MQTHTLCVPAYCLCRKAIKACQYTDLKPISAQTTVGAYTFCKFCHLIYDGKGSAKDGFICCCMTANEGLQVQEEFK
ncbi:hypothetical protein C5167_050797 [Papaver somniferum]|uniref:Uncharacterized protein n=1 Tax=Papaver somniferum TaxID=3469 RepID=A0A4Y7KPP8_PAPSO|nr:hypothetical protein C5167_050797 [Papaver somniferum]